MMMEIVDDQYCRRCNALQTEADEEMGACTQCGFDEDDDTDRCEAYVDLGCRCIGKAVRIIREPFTPAGFKQRLCAECAAGELRQGYLDGGPIEEGEA